MRNELIRVLLNKFKSGEISRELVYKLLMDLDIMSKPSVYQCSEVSDEFLRLLGDRTTVIFK